MAANVIPYSTEGQKLFLVKTYHCVYGINVR